MKFAGPTHDGANWSEASLLEIMFESRDELEKNNAKYFKAGRGVARTSTKANPGDKKQLKYHLPDGKSFTLAGVVEKVKEQPGKNYAVSLFKFENVSDEQKEMVQSALKEKKKDISVDDLDFDLGQDQMEIQGNSIVVPEKVEPEKQVRHVEGRSEQDEALVRAMLAEDAPENENLIEVELPPELQGVSGDLLMPKTGDDDQPDPFLEQKKYIIAFILTFTKSVQRSGYYGDSEHPEALEAKKGLYSLFRKIIGVNREMNFIRKDTEDGKDVLIDGVLEDMISLREIMPHGMADLYIPKFMEYLERRCLISLSIKRIINEENFNQFIDLMSKYSREFKDDARKEGERFTRTLIEHGIVEVSTIFDEDIISSGRKLPWQAELTLARLRKDLKTVPLLKNATDEELRAIKIRIFQDTVKPLRNPSFLIAVLLNADLIMEGIEDSPVLKELDVEQFMIEGVETDFLATTSLDLIKEFKGVKELQKKAPLETQRNAAKKQEKILYRITNHVTDRLLKEKGDSVDNTLEEFFNNKMIPFKTLPIRIQERISNKKLTEAFLQNSDEIIKRFDSNLSGKEFSEFINRYQRIIPLLSEKKEFMLVGRIIESVRKHLDDRDVRRKSLTKRFFDYISTTSTLDDLKEAFQSEDKELRNLAASVFVSFGRQSVPMLLDILKDHEDKWVRKLVIRSVQDIGSDAVQPMVNELYKEDNPWYFLRNIIKLLGELGDRKIVGKLTLLLYHENSSVREETIYALFRIAPQVSESHLIKALGDEEPKVRLRAIGCLGTMKSHNERVFRYYQDVLEGRAAVDDEAMEIQVYRALGQLDKIDESRRAAFEDKMLSKMEEAYGSGIMALLKRRNTEKVSGGIKLAICTALGKLSTSKRAKRLLTRLAAEKDPILSERAKTALKDMAARSH